MENLYKDAEKKQIIESLPASPIFVKSYDNRYPDYYLVPFIREQQFVGQVLWGVEVRSNTGIRTSVLFTDHPQPTDLVFPRGKLLNVDVTDAIEIIKQTKEVTEVPVPRLVYKGGEISKSPYQPFWEFTLKDNAKLYVNQEGKVFDSNIIPWYQTYVAPKYNPEAVQVKLNKLIREDFTVTLSSATRLQHYQTKKLQGMEIGINVENIAGINERFIPRGKITGIIGRSGKVYRSTNGAVQDLEEVSLRIAKGREWQSERDGKPFQPGVYKLGYDYSVDPDDQEISKVLYLDENNREIEIPVGGIDYQVRDVGNGK
jgi:hypothetical protein